MWPTEPFKNANGLWNFRALKIAIFVVNDVKEIFRGISKVDFQYKDISNTENSIVGVNGQNDI